MPDEITSEWKARLFDKLNNIKDSIAEQNTSIKLLQFQVKLMWGVFGFIGSVIGTTIIVMLLKGVLNVEAN